MGEFDSDGDARDPIKLAELGSDQILIGESPRPSSQSNEVSFPSVFQISIISGRIIIDADLTIQQAARAPIARPQAGMRQKIRVGELSIYAPLPPLVLNKPNKPARQAAHPE